MVELFSVDLKPWVFRARNISRYKSLEGIIFLDGKKMGSLADFYDEISRAFRMPDYFGRNFNALSEMLADLSWLKQDIYLVLIGGGENVLSGEPRDALEGFLELLNDIGEEWSKPVKLGQEWDRSAISFHSVFECDASKDLQSVLCSLPEVPSPTRSHSPHSSTGST